MLANLKNKVYFKSAVLMAFETDKAFLAAAGQFVNILVPGHEFKLRRPFSIFSSEGNIFEVLIRVVGKGTESITEMAVGDKTDVLIPLGSDSRIETDKNTLLIAGGIGIAGISTFYSSDTKMIFGDRNGEYRDIVDQYFPNAMYITETGIIGEKGVVTDYMNEFDFDTIIACGPKPMLKAVKENNIDNKPYYAVCESIMACGMGLCSGCTVKYTDSTFRKVCKDGPVLDGMRIVYD